MIQVTTRQVGSKRRLRPQKFGVRRFIVAFPSSAVTLSRIAYGRRRELKAKRGVLE